MKDRLERVAMAFSRFHNSDLQVHTPADRQHRYGDTGSRTPNLAFARKLMEAHSKTGVDIVAVTDHNRVDWYPVLSEAGQTCGVYVFPGIEISVNGCHLIVLWDRTDEGYDLAQRFLQTLWPPGQSPFYDNGDPKPVASGQVLEVAERASEHRALVLAPHSTARNIGIFAKGVCRNHREVARSGSVLGYDVFGDRNADVLTNPKAVFGSIPPAWFISGDVRALEQVGRRTTYLKLSPEPTLEGIRQAFLMPDSRLRFPQSLHSEWQHVSGAQFLDSPNPSWPRLQSVEIEGGFHAGLKADIAPGLNAVIGGKGTGKSTLIEIIRYVLDGGEPIVEDGRANRRTNFRANAEANIRIVDSQGEPYTIHRSGDDAPARLLRDGRDTEVDVRRRLDVTVFGQRELQELANREELLREFVASQAGSDWDSAVREESDLIAVLRSADAELSQLETDLARVQEYTEELKDIMERLSRARDKGADNLVEESNALAEIDRVVTEVLTWPDKVSAAVDGLEETMPLPNLTSHHLLPENLRDDAGQLEDAVKRTVGELRTAIDSTAAKMKAHSISWKKNHDEERHRIQSELAEAGIANPEELDDLQRRRARLANLVDNQASAMKRRNELFGQRKQQLVALAEIRRRKSRLTEGAAKTLTDRVGERIRVRTNPLADRSKLLALFEEQLRGQNVRKAQLERLVESLPSTIAAAMLAGPKALEEDLGCSPATAVRLSELPPSVARACEECDTPDQVTVEINLGGGGVENWTSVQMVSPGQRATALLALALVSGRSPLIIDQPEDDLDNRYIYDEVVKVLRAVCKTRQVIVATHNANVAVLGDAELVLALDADSGQGRVLALGGLESPGVAEATRRILEGGDEAFRARHRRYLASEAHPA